ncbi:DNA-binding MurR/RpiR family transcriptional regulator [Devosia sp. UYZn731]|uniref:MurR/RpiR family transcriptional regulator n=1 Tax=Devosia sp. UYZn731 TaxID=3156345 RepID=UPI00339A0326
MTGAAKTFSVVDRIVTYQSQMPVTMAKIAAVLIADPRAPLALSITELAKRAGTSAATVTRFCRLIGYAGFSDLRVGIAEDVGRGGSQAAWIADIGRSFGPDDPPEDIRDALFNTHMLSLQTTAGLIDIPTAVRIAKAIVASRHLDVYGVGGSALTALETEARLYRIGIGVHAWSEIHDGLTSAAILDQHCVAIGISNTGRTEETIQMLAVAKAAGAYTVAITANPASPLAKLAHDVLIAASPNGYLQPADLSARHCQLFVVDLLYLLIAQLDYDRTTRLLAASGAAVAPRRRPFRRGAFSQSAAGLAVAERPKEPSSL